MNGIHDMGGMHCMGPIQPERIEPVFREAWGGFCLRRFMGRSPCASLIQQRDSGSRAARSGKESTHERST